MAFTIEQVDWNDVSHISAIQECIDRYMHDPMGDAPGHTLLQKEMLVNGLKHHPKGIFFIAFAEETPAGCIICFETFSTFLARPVINIHDLIVIPVYRGIGIGRALMHRVFEEAAVRGCGKVTLEVREDNLIARQLYGSEGFSECKPVMRFWVKMM